MHNDPVIVRMRHIREHKLCTRGVRAWLVARGFDWREVVLNGLPVEQLESTGDPLVMPICESARKENNGQQ